MRFTPAMVALVLFLGPAAPPASAGVVVEYIGHASFVIESPAGVRVVLDPFNSNRWLGYRYPDDVEADVVLVTHPHYDHDASYYWGDSVPVFREPGRYQVGDVSLVGVKGQHAGRFGTDFGQKNTIWIVEASGVRIAHLGDNGPLTAENVRALGRIDVLMIPADGDDHILKPDAIAAIRRELSDPLVIPMHYRLEGFLGLPRSLGPIEPWLERQEGVVRLASNRAELGGKKVEGRKVLVFRPSPELEPWSSELAHGWELLDEARRAMASEPADRARAGALVKEAHESARCIVFEFQWARALAQSGDTAGAMDVLEKALARAGRDDWEYRMRARSLLAELYQAAGRSSEAATQHRIVLANSYRTDLLEKARAFLASGH